MSRRTAPRLLRFPEVKHRTGLSRTSLFRAVRAGRFPAPIHLELGERSRCVAWPEASVDAWIEARVAAAASPEPQPAAPVKRGRGRPQKHPPPVGT
ncbi:AlpA family phage regulatory protein [Lysobacter sp. KIS68-7]|uniref:helix-turn-helix transcriptional regulator n=1 Tax=Lysobacter sp. KIS68-7 TaxID=2904252 RepID=UPI001E5CD8ED|nr:AlpA family phage regulatory protein [Lysobacter sp. KIS68-7]UHQ19185.1 AlpA family phage regulatory protein [Lysobacter sp. KIS68-7]